MQEMSEMWVWSLGQENPLEKEMATCSSIPAWEIPQTEEPGGLQFTGLQRVGNYSCLAAIHHSLQDKRFEKMPPIPCPAHCFWWHVQTVVRKHLQRWGPPGDLPTVRNWAFYLLSLSFQFSSVAQSCPTLWDPMDCSTPGFPVRHQLPELDQTQVHQVGDATIYLYLSITPSLSISMVPSKTLSIQSAPAKRVTCQAGQWEEQESPVFWTRSQVAAQRIQGLLQGM